MDLVGGIPTPLKNMKVSWDDDIPNIWRNKMSQTGPKPPTSLVLPADFGLRKEHWDVTYFTGSRVLVIENKARHLLGNSGSKAGGKFRQCLMA